MPDVSDMELLRNYSRQGSDEAFAELVRRHINLVYSTAIRHAGIVVPAEEITQAVFIILARKAAGLREETILEAWLYETTRLASLNFLRGERRRQLREQEAYMQSTIQEPADVPAWNQFAPLLDEAMSRLGRKDREAVVLRFFKEKSLNEVADAMKITEAAAQSRVHRAVEKLRRFFMKRGVVSTGAIIAGAISANSVHAAPAALANSVTAIAITKGAAVSGSTLTLIKGALKIMAWTKAKSAIVVTAGVLLAAGTATVAVKEIKAHQTPIWQERFDLSLLDKLPPQVAILPSRPSTISSGWHAAGSNRTGKMQGLGQSIPDIVMAAHGYKYHLAQINFSSAVVPPGKFDYIVTLPTRRQEALREELRRKFGFVGHPQTLEADCLLLKVKSRNAPGLKRSSLPSEGSLQDDSYSAHNQTLWSLADYLADHLGTIVIDRTGLTGNFDVDFTWDKTPEGLKSALLEQTGLELVPAKEPIEFLIVEDENHPPVGIGVSLMVDPQTQKLKIGRVFPNSSAEQAGLSTGSIVQKIDGISVTDKKLAECVTLIRGPVGTKVQLEVITADGSQTNTVELTRQKIQL